MAFLFGALGIGMGDGCVLRCGEEAGMKKEGVIEWQKGLPSD